LFLIKWLFLDVTEISYNNGRSRLLNKNQSILEDIEFTSDSDYCDSSEKKSAKKRKNKKRETKKNSKSKKKKIEKKIVTLHQNIDQTSSTTISLKESDNSIKKGITISPIKSESINSSNINKITEESRVNKYLNKSIKNSKKLRNTSNNDHLLSKKCDSVNNNARSKVLIIKQSPLNNLEKPHNSSLTSLNSQVNTKYPPNYMPKLFMTPTLKIVDIKSTRNFSTLVPIQIKDAEEYVIDGMSQLIYTTENIKFTILMKVNI